jgi:ATP-dependent Lon protease
MEKSKIKLNIINYKYTYLTDIILNLQKHINNLFNVYMLDYVNKNNFIKNIFDINKVINEQYNNYILNQINSDSSEFNNLIELYNILPNNENYIISFLKLYNNKLPLYNLELDLINIIYDIGYISLVSIFDILILCNNIKITINQTELLNELDNIFIPTKIRIFNVMNNDNEFYWRIPNDYNDNDLLKLTRELWIKNMNNKCEYIKIEGYFINDNISCIIKTSQLKYKILDNKKKITMELLNKSIVDNKFIKKIINYDYIGNLYCMDSINYVDYINSLYNEYLHLSKLTFVNIMKNFISKESNIQNMYRIILLLLLGNSNNKDIASLLLNLTKEKKTLIPYIYNIILNNLPYYLHVLIKKSNNNMNDELEKMKSLVVDDVSYKTQLILNKNIPENIKLLVLEKIEEMKSVNNEYYKQLIYVKHILNFPWSSKNDNLLFENLNNERAITYLDKIETSLTKLSYGHTEAKKILLQVIGKWISNSSSQGTSFGLVGPPGVGKTLFAKSVSKALDIPFAEITLGGQNDGELLHGHGYTYAGSQPGMIIKKMVEMGKSRCILYFDELDKACSKHGSVNEITSILIHLTDPNMNKKFQDRFFQGIDFPLDKIIMIFSYNDAKLVDPILLDRLTQINIDAYTISDKIIIVKNHIIPELAESIGLKSEKWINISDELIEYIINNYTSEAGVRSIKRHIEKLFLTLNLDKIYKRNNFANNNDFVITKDIIIKILDKSQNNVLTIHNEPIIGIISGLYATTNGDGGIIPIQIFNNISSNNNFFEMKYTGKQGDTMKESVQCSFTAATEYIKRNIHKYNFINNIDDYILQKFKHGFHIHTPSTSTPKDGPSAGCAFTTAFISRILDKPIKNTIAMTGEIELTGKITKIGGLNFKLIGAKKANVNVVYVPYENENDIIEIKSKYPNLIDESFNVKFFNYIDEIIDDVLL